MPTNDSPIIAVVDDDTAIATLIGRIVELSLSAQVLYGSDGPDAITLRFGTPEPDLLVVNGKMPTMNGPEAVDAIRARERGQGRPPVPILLSSAWPDVERTARAHGAEAALGHPFTPQELLDAVRPLLALAVVRRDVTAARR